MNLSIRRKDTMNTKKLLIGLLLVTSGCYGADAKNVTQALKNIQTDIAFLKLYLKSNPELKGFVEKKMHAPALTFAAAIHAIKSNLEGTIEDIEELPRRSIPVPAPQPVHPTQAPEYLLLGIQNGKISPRVVGEK